MPARLTPILAVLCIALTLGKHERLQSSSQTSTASDQEKCLIEGLVTSAPTGEPLKGAEVYLTAPESYKSLYNVVTDATGRFSLENIEPGQYQLQASKRGYYDPSRKCDSEDIQVGDNVILAPGQRLSDVKLRLLAPAVITGTVFDPDGDPLPYADVQAVRFRSFLGERKIGVGGFSQTDDRGQFRIFHLEPGRYFVRVKEAFYFEHRSDSGEHEPNAQQVNGFLPIYYPDATDLGQATLFDLEPGEELPQVNFAVHLTQVLRIRGNVVNGLTDEPLSDGTVAIKSMPPAIQENEAGSMTVREDSHFEIKDLVPGKYVVSAEAWVLPDRRRWGGWRQIDLTDSSLNDVQIRVFPSYDLIGRIESPGDERFEFGHLQVVLESHNDLNYGGTFANVKTDGTFLLPDVKQDTYDLDVAGLPNGYYLKSATLGTVDVTDGLNIGGENPTSPLVLQLSPLGARVDGVVLTAGGKQACSATVVLVPDGSRRSNQRFYQEADVDRTGHYVLRGIAPGDYKLFAFDDVSDVGYLDPGSLRIYENRGQSAHFGVGDRQTVLLRIILTGTRNP